MNDLRNLTILAMTLFILVLGLLGCGQKDQNKTTDTGLGDKSGQTSDSNGSTQPNNESKLVSISSYAPGQTTPDRLISQGKTNDLALSYNYLAIDMYKYFITDSSINFVFGPYSFLQVLGMSAKGAKTETLEEIRKAFFFEQETEDWFNSVYYLEKLVNQTGQSSKNSFTVKNIALGQTNYLFSRDYLDKLTKYDSPALSGMDFLNLGSSFNTDLDKWTSEATFSRLRSLSLYSDTIQRTRLILGNLTWLENEWETTTDNIQSFDGIFEKNSGEQYNVPMVRHTGRFNYYNDDSVTAFELPIGSSGKSFTVFMPNKGQFDAFSEKLKDRIPSIISGLAPKDVEIVLPVFDINMHSNMTDFMKAAGMSTAFDEKYADFSGVNGLGYCYLKDYQETATISAGKESLYAGSAAAASIEGTPDEPKELWSNLGLIGLTLTSGNDFLSICQKPVPDARPFVFIIRDTSTNTILLIGRLLDAGGETVKLVCL